MDGPLICITFFFRISKTAGIAAALKILFSSDKWDEIPVVNGKKFSLSRTEVVALFNALNK